MVCDKNTDSKNNRNTQQKDSSMRHGDWNGKVTQKHSTYTETSDFIVVLAASLNEVKSIVLGHISHVGGGRRELKFKPINGGINAKVRGDGAVQELYIYTSSTSEVVDILTSKFKEEFGV